MGRELEPDTEPGITTLVTGIAHDFRELLVKQMTLFQVEVKNDVRHGVTAAIPLVAGLMLCVAALVILSVAGAYGLHAIIPDLPLWGSFAIVGVLIALAGAGLIMRGISLFERIRPPPNKTLEGLKE